MSSSALLLVRRATSALAVVAVMVAGAPTLTSPDDIQPSSEAATPSPDAEAEAVDLAVPEVAAEQAQQPAEAQSAPGEPSSGERAVVAERSSTRTQDYGLVGVTWAPDTAPTDLEVQVRTRTEGEWSAWEPLDVETTSAQETPDTRGGTAPTWVGESDGVAVRLLSAEQAPEDVQVVLIDGGTGLAEPALQLMSGTTEETDGVAPKPRILTRRQWGVNETYQSDCSAPRFASTAKGIVLHHTAGANGYTRDEAAGIVRGIHLYHTRSLGWCDIGYNFLVDTYGTIYAGRRGGQNRQVRGAHAGNWDANTYLTGISMMGNYDTVGLPRALKKSVVALSAWRLSYFGRDAIGKVRIDEGRLNIISGHRDISLAGITPSTATACPGRYGVDWLNGGMRQQVQAIIDVAKEEITDEPVEEPTPEPEPEPEPTVTSRMSGQSRYATAARISANSFPSTSENVFLTSGQTFPDALSGGPAAGRMNAPILLTRQDELPAATARELSRLAPKRVFVLGGEGAISEAVLQQVQSYAPTVTRLSGRNRYATGVAISQNLWSAAGVVYVTSGSGYADALSGGALAARDNAPILLSRTDKLPRVMKRELSRLSPERVVLLGGVAALDKSVRDQIAGMLPEATVRRLSGRNRYATSAAIANAGWSRSSRAYFAAGTNFPDALAGVPAAALTGAPLMLTKPTCLPTAVAKAVDSLGVDSRILLGGASVVADSAATTTCS